MIPEARRLSLLAFFSVLYRSKRERSVARSQIRLAISLGFLLVVNFRPGVAKALGFRSASVVLVSRQLTVNAKGETPIMNVERFPASCSMTTY